MKHAKIFSRLLDAYDEALANGTPTGAIDESVPDGDLEFLTVWEEAKSSLELLHRVRHRNPPPTLVHPPLNGADGAQTSSDVSQLKRVGRFLIEREVGRGGLGVVFLAVDPRLGRKVAVKIPHFSALFSDVLRRRFLREAEAAARLSHPHLVALHEVGEDGPICYLASEYCAGPTLAEWLRERKTPVPVRQVAARAAQLADAVQHAHSRGVLHRDIKPSNVLLEETTVDGGQAVANEASEVVPKLTDFGMAKLLEQSGGETRTGESLALRPTCRRNRRKGASTSSTLARMFTRWAPCCTNCSWARRHSAAKPTWTR